MEEIKVVIKCDNYHVSYDYFSDGCDPIIEEGLEFEFIDGSRERVAYQLEGDTYIANIPFNYRMATKEEKQLYYMKKGHLFKGQEVEIVKGRKLPIGSKHIIKSFYRYNVAGTYGHCYTDYVVFEDGTKTDVMNIRPTCELNEGVDFFYETDIKL